ncbi:MAG: hypothetical protein ACYC2K_08820 [Gemmatimonadales bacterium]
MSARLEPSTVKRGEQLWIRAEMLNRSDAPVSYASGNSCAYGVRITRKGVDYSGLSLEAIQSCLDVISSFPVPANSVRTFPFRLTANAPPGEYEVHVIWSLQPFVRPLTTKLVIR